MDFIGKTEEATKVSLIGRGLKLLFLTVALSHLVACVKFIVLLDPQEPRLSDLQKRTSFGQYLQSMYWGMAAVTGRDDSNPPETFVDTLFPVSLMLVGVIWLAYIIASLEQFSDQTHSPNHIHIFQAKLNYTTQFMIDSQLPLSLQLQVKNFYSYLWSSQLR